MAEKWQVKDHESEKYLVNRRLVVASGMVAFLLVALIAKLVNLQVFQNEYFTARSDDNRLHSQYVPPSRGLIFDRNGVLLADNQPIFNLTVVSELVEDMDSSLEFLSSIIQLSSDDIEQFGNRLNRPRVPYSSVLLRYQLNEEEMAKIAVAQHRLPGFSREAQLVRHYPFENLTAHSVGYVSEINQEEIDRMSDEDRENYGGTNHIGKTGIEKTYEHILHGRVGYETVEKNNRGQVMRVLDHTNSVAGNNITLHMDAQLQIAAEKALGDFRGAIVAIEPETGGILAIVSKPGFDPNLFVTGISNKDYGKLVTDIINTPLFDRATNPYPPGSTIKPFLGLGGLHNEVIDYDYVIEDPGYFRLPGVSHRWHDWTFRNAIGGGHGLIDLKRAIYQSCDTFFYNLGNQMGITMIHDFMSLFGFGQNFALDIPFARTGVLPSREWKEESRGEPWYQGDTINSAIGQGYMWTTPLQLATAIAIIANKGKVVQPRMLQAINGQPYNHELEESVADVILNDPDYWDYIEDGMTKVVHRAYTKKFRDSGTAYEAIAQADPDMPYKMAGKSGTAQVVGIAQNIRKSVDIEVADLNKDHGLFVAYAPAQNPLVKPKIVVAVFVENGESGGSVAGPIAKQIIDIYLLDILGIEHETLRASEDLTETLVTSIE